MHHAGSSRSRWTPSLTEDRLTVVIVSSMVPRGQTTALFALKRYTVQIIEPGAVEAPNHKHHILNHNRLVESASLGHLTRGVDLLPEALVDIKLEKVVESLLVCVDAPEDDYLILTGDCRVPIARLGSRSFDTSDLKPKIRQEGVLVDIVHGVMAIPSADHKHVVFADDG